MYTFLILLLLIAVAMLVMPSPTYALSAERFDAVPCMVDCEAWPEETRGMCQQQCAERKDEDTDNDEDGIREQRAYRRGRRTAGEYDDGDD